MKKSLKNKNRFPCSTFVDLNGGAGDIRRFARTLSAGKQYRLKDSQALFTRLC